MTTPLNSNIILIGMPGAGKSTVGVQLAKHCGLNFLDTDLVIQEQEGRILQDIVDNDGYLVLREMEAKVLEQLHCEHTLIATGGSAIYSASGMKNLQSLGPVVYLEVGLETLQARVNSDNPRGIACPKGQTFADVYHERVPLYEQYADITYNNESTTNIEQLAEHIIHYLK